MQNRPAAAAALRTNWASSPSPFAASSASRPTTRTISTTACRSPHREERQAHCLHRRRARFADRLRDLAQHGYQVTVFDSEAKAGGFIRSQIPKFRLPEEVIDEETGYILDLGVQFVGGQRIDSLAKLAGPEL
ncbi:hypothetical protein LP420_06280 [Massilia sp. B-10]|nr:hypothetical protein LP420_06280 [Massilia sp. B-10]